MVGVLGGFTTFSTFGLETYNLLANSKYQTAFFYVILSNICGLAAVYAGIKISSLTL
jgi:CrcB protein